jgi:hypothetical protein
MLFNSNNSFFFYKDNIYTVDDYYQNIVKLIKNILQNNPELKINILLCASYKFNNNNKTLIININFEHTLVKKNGRSVPRGTPFGNINDDNNQKYLVRIDNYDNIKNSDIIIDYSNPNIYNIKSCPIYNLFSKKHIYISSSIYEPYFIKENRNLISLSTFINTNEPRRKELLNKIQEQKIKHVNVNNCFKENELRNLYIETKILINIHQTPHHHTFEELRVLPALECGVIVICENSPLIDTIPYKNLIIWESYENIIEKTKELISNYEYFHNKIFSQENIDILINLKKINYNVLYNAIIEKIT